MVVVEKIERNGVTYYRFYVEKNGKKEKIVTTNKKWAERIARASKVVIDNKGMITYFGERKNEKPTIIDLARHGKKYQSAISSAVDKLVRSYEEQVSAYKKEGYKVFTKEEWERIANKTAFARDIKARKVVIVPSKEEYVSQGVEGIKIEIIKPDIMQVKTASGVMNVRMIGQAGYDVSKLPKEAMGKVKIDEKEYKVPFKLVEISKGVWSYRPDISALPKDVKSKLRQKPLTQEDIDKTIGKKTFPTLSKIIPAEYLGKAVREMQYREEPVPQQVLRGAYSLVAGTVLSGAEIIASTEKTLWDIGWYAGKGDWVSLKKSTDAYLSEMKRFGKGFVSGFVEIGKGSVELKPYYLTQLGMMLIPFARGVRTVRGIRERIRIEPLIPKRVRTTKVGVGYVIDMRPLKERLKSKLPSIPKVKLPSMRIGEKVSKILPKRYEYIIGEPKEILKITPEDIKLPVGKARIIDIYYYQKTPQVVSYTKWLGFRFGKKVIPESEFSRSARILLGYKKGKGLVADVTDIYPHEKTLFFERFKPKHLKIIESKDIRVIEKKMIPEVRAVLSLRGFTEYYRIKTRTLVRDFLYGRPTEPSFKIFGYPKTEEFRLLEPPKRFPKGEVTGKTSKIVFGRDILKDIEPKKGVLSGKGQKLLTKVEEKAKVKEKVKLEQKLKVKTLTAVETSLMKERLFTAFKFLRKVKLPTAYLVPMKLKVEKITAPKYKLKFITPQIQRQVIGIKTRLKLSVPELQKVPVTLSLGVPTLLYTSVKIKQKISVPLKYSLIKESFRGTILPKLRASPSLKKPSLRKLSKREYKYTPDVYALTFGVKMPKVKIPKAVTGLELRGIPV